MPHDSLVFVAQSQCVMSGRCILHFLDFFPAKAENVAISKKTTYTGWAKSDTLLVFDFLLLLDALYLQFLFTHVAYHFQEAKMT